jgi:cephalosporin-C deacetylase-like acetyl esterase
VDPKRVACTGNSGGGTHTAYISALDDRIAVAAPSCYISSWSRMLRGLGPQDAEQVLPNWLKDGLDYPDFVYAFGPKPYLVLSAIRDFFPIEGARETFGELKSVFSRAGIGDRVSMFEADDGHGYTAPRRAAAYAWLHRWLKGSAEGDPEKEIRPELPGDLECTETGQVSTSLRGEDVYTLNRKRAAALRPGTSKPGQVLEGARLRSGFASLKGVPAVRSYGSIARQGYRIEKLVYESEPGISVPALLWLPEGGPSRKPGMLVVDGAGKAASGAASERFARAGTVVLSIDARGFGETRPPLDPGESDFVRYFGDYDSGMTALLIGKTLPGMRAGDIVRAIDLLAGRPDVDPARLSAYGKQAGAVALLYAAAFDGRLRAVALERMLASYSAVVNQRIHRNVFEQVVPGALRDYDLPDLVATLAPRPVWLIDAVDPLDNPMRAAEVRRVYPRSEIRIRETRPEESATGILDEFAQALR